MKEVWKFLDGNKTIFGALVIALTTAHVEPHTVLYTIGMWAGGALGIGGPIHKVLKRVKEKKAEK